VLNRLGAEGLIAAFRTSFRGPAPELGVHVIVTPGEPVTDEQADALRCRVGSALSERVPATVTVDRSLGYNRRQT
jgi:hypothetical protein